MKQRPYERTRANFLLKRSLVTATLASFLFAQAHNAYAAQTDVSNLPLASSMTTEVKPNIFFILDDSGSMAWAHMPDAVQGWRGAPGYKNYLCNSIYYNPSVTYVLPRKSDGTNYPAANFTAALDNGFDTSATPSKTDLSTSFQAFDSVTGDLNRGDPEDTNQAAYYYKWNGTNPPTTTNCSNTSTNWQKVTISSSAEKQNFANWYSYYRTRILMMKSASGRAFVQLTNKYRVGFITINPGSTVSTNKFLPITDFDQTQKNKWFDILYKQ